MMEFHYPEEAAFAMPAGYGVSAGGGDGVLLAKTGSLLSGALSLIWRWRGAGTSERRCRQWQGARSISALPISASRESV